MQSLHDFYDRLKNESKLTDSKLELSHNAYIFVYRLSLLSCNVIVDVVNQCKKSIQVLNQVLNNEL